MLHFKDIHHVGVHAAQYEKNKVSSLHIKYN